MNARRLNGRDIDEMSSRQPNAMTTSIIGEQDNHLDKKEQEGERPFSTQNAQKKAVQNDIRRRIVIYMTKNPYLCPYNFK